MVLDQHFRNGDELVNGVAMHAENPDNFQIPHSVLKKHVGDDHFVGMRIDSPRFSVHKDAAGKCYCLTCNGAWFVGKVDKPTYEARLHELNQCAFIYFHDDHIFAVHGSHREEIGG